MHYVFITGGVASSLGKGLAAASIASLLQLRNFKIRLRKLDPYLNQLIEDIVVGQERESLDG